MTESKTNPKSKIKLYERPEFVLLLLTGFLWLAFLYKIFFVTEAEVIPKTNPHGVIITKSSIEIPLDKKADPQARSRNKPNTKKTKSKEDQETIEAIRESFDEAKPSKNNQIIRGKLIPAIEGTADGFSEKIQILVNDETEMDSLNADYKRALKGRN